MFRLFIKDKNSSAHVSVKVRKWNAWCGDHLFDMLNSLNKIYAENVNRVFFFFAFK